MSAPNHARSKSFAGRSGLPLLALLAAVAGCGDAYGTATGDGVPLDADGGSLSFGMTLPRGVEFDAFHYVIVGPGYSRSGGIDLVDSTTVSTLVEGIPVASGYTVTLMGTITSPTSAECSGSAPFAIAPGEVTTVAVAVACHEVDAPTPPPPARVPIPPLAAAALGVLLLAAGAFVRGPGLSASRCRNRR